MQKRHSIKGSLPLLICLFVASLAMFFFGWLAEEMMEGDTHDFDTVLLLAFRDPVDLSDPIGPRWLVHAMIDVTSLGGGVIVTLLTLVIAGYFLIKKNYYDVLLLALSTGGGAIISNILKHSFERPRPDLVAHLVKVNTLSFPSGHTMAAVIAYITIGALLARKQNRNVRLYIFAISTLLAASIGISRVYLGVHWPTDVLASWSLGIFWVILCWLFTAWLQSKNKAIKI